MSRLNRVSIEPDQSKLSLQAVSLPERSIKSFQIPLFHFKQQESHHHSFHYLF